MKQQFGLEFTTGILQRLKDEALQRAKEFCGNVGESFALYDLNPMSNPAHSEWFLLPRPNPTFKNYVVRHPEMEKVLVEFQIPKKTCFAIDGVWPSLVDCGVNKPVQVSNDPRPSSLVYGMTTAEEEKKEMESTWQPFYQDLHYAISKYPLGIILPEFRNVLVQRKWKNLGQLLKSTSLTQIVTSLPEVFDAEEIRFSKSQSVLILFPAYMRGKIC